MKRGLSSRRKPRPGIDPAGLEAHADRLRELAADPTLVSGIHNYCDRWCERCTQRGRCLVFRMERAASESGPDQPSPDAFWTTLERNLAVTLHLLRQDAAKWGIDLQAVATTEAKDTLADQRRARRRSPLVRAALDYADIAGSLLEEIRGELPELESDLNREVRLGIGDPEEAAVTIVEAWEVIAWYQHFIAVKLARAESGLGHDIAHESDADDANGSAKVALIALERSLAAWACLRMIVTAHADSALRILVRLERLRGQVEERFPEARKFRRPGFE